MFATVATRVAMAFKNDVCSADDNVVKSTAPMDSVNAFLASVVVEVVVMLVVLFGIWKFAVDRLLPILSAALDCHLNALNELVKTNQADHKAMLESLQGIEAKLEHNAKRAHELRGNGRA